MNLSGIGDGYSIGVTVPNVTPRSFEHRRQTDYATSEVAI